MITHTVTFSLIHEAGSIKEKDFLDTAVEVLQGIPSVENFRVFRQVSRKCPHSFLFHMTFRDNEAYSAYNRHPAHTAFVETRWAPEVSDFQEIDLEAYTPDTMGGGPHVVQRPDHHDV